ncbi:MAG: family acetyltransferase [Flavipsychrobacter sp.]|nr:family acetyltransferase [Flavipsychrobacter sp.]
MRDLLPSDDIAMLELNSDPEVYKYLGRKPISTIEESQYAIAFIRGQYETNGIGRWAVIEKETNEFVGWSGLKLMTTETNGHINYLDLGYRFMKRYWGKGYATETALTAVQYAWNELQATRLCGMADVNNAASRNVLEKCGLKPGDIFDYEGDPHIWYEMARP